MKYKTIACAQLLIFWCTFSLVGCGGGGGGGGHSSHGSSGNATSVPTTTPSATLIAGSVPAQPANNSSVQACPISSSYSLVAPPPQTAGVISGRITFDRVMFSDPGNNPGKGLDYNNQQVQPARGLVVEALASNDGAQCNGAVVATALTDGDGWYQLMPSTSANVCVRARAQMYRVSDGASVANWNVSVADNTNSNALYAMTEMSAASVGDRPRRDLHATSGWVGGGYSAARIAAPFAILDTACKTMNAVVGNAGPTQLGVLTFFWSVKNTSDGDGSTTLQRQQGKIGGAFFDHREIAIYLRGDAVVNTDEFDEMVIGHEFGHFVTHTLSRSDSIGGDHSLIDYEDPRLAFDEGWATAFAALALPEYNHMYRDSEEAVPFGVNGWREYKFDVSQQVSPMGWYSEGSIQRVLYTLGRDTTTGGVGLGGLLQTFANSNYRQADALASIFSYASYLLNDQPSNASAITTALNDENIDGNDVSPFADQERNAPAAKPDFYYLPVYTVLDTLGSSGTQKVCTSNFHGTENALSNRRYIRFKPPQMARYRFSVKPENTSSSSGGVAGFELLDRGRSIGYYEGTAPGSTLTGVSSSALQSGRSYVLGIFHVGNAVKDAKVVPGDQCFFVSAATIP